MRTLPLLITLILSGCSSPPPVPAEVARQCGESPSAGCRYFAEVNQLIRHNFTDYQRYRGQQCDVRATRNADGSYAVVRTEGDEALCLRAWQLVASAPGLPLPPTGVSDQVIFAFVPE